MTEWQRRQGAGPLRVVVCGEARSGKSALLNALMRRRIVPDNLGAQRRALVVLRGKAGLSLTLSRRDGGIWRDLPAPPGEPASDVSAATALTGAGAIRIGSPQPHLAGIELIELPLTTAAQLLPDHIATVREADALIWMTIASQAWRLTERQILDALGAHLPPHRMMVLSRTDKLRRMEDALRIRDRVRSEAGDYFRQIGFLGAGRQMLEEVAFSDTAWADTGASDIVGQIAGWLPPVAHGPVPDMSQDAQDREQIADGRHATVL